jgi:hypothetical protein
MNLLAYIDPGAGLLAWQTVVAAFVGVVFYLKKTRDAIARFGRKLLRRDEAAGFGSNSCARAAILARP